MGAIDVIVADNILRQSVNELEKIQTESKPLRARLGKFGASLLLFFLLGLVLTFLTGSSFLSELLLLILILFIHELGHFLAMRHFGYRNLEMFFIPFFGAAVSGYGCVSVFQESVVYLLGPLPGIFIGVVLAFVYPYIHNQFLFQAAQWFVILNALNLLPIFPLDGGRFVFGLLPRRTYPFQWILHVVLAVSILFILAPVGSRISTVLFVPSIFGVVILYNVNKADTRLGATGILPTTFESKQIPTELAGEMVSVVREATRVKRPTELAEMVWIIWTRLQAERPSFVQTFFLLAAYIGALLLVIGVWFLYLAN